MANISILNPTLLDNGTGSPFTNWGIGANAAWTPSDTYPLSNGADGNYVSPGDNTLFQTNVFTDFGTSTSHIIEVNILGASSPFAIDVMFGTATATTITTTGISLAIGAAVGNATLTFNIRQGSANIDFVKDCSSIIISSFTGASQGFIAPVYNPIYFNVLSVFYSFPNYKYVFDIFTGNTGGGNAQARVKLLPRPGSTGNCIFSPARILESYLGCDARIQNIVEPTNSNKHMIPYILKIGEEYGTLNTGVTIYSALTFFSGYTFNGVNQYEQIPSWNYSDYLMGGSTKKFLTNQPAEVYIKNSTDRGTLSFMQIYSAATRMKLITYQNSGGTKTYYLANTGITSDSVVHIPSGIWNLNNLPNSGATINLSTDYKYSLNADNGSTISEVKTYLIDTKCGKYSTVRLQFLNRLGGFDYFNFNLVSKKTISVTRNTYRKVLDYNYQLGDRGSTVLDVDGQYSYKVTSDWISDVESVWLEELITSPEVFVINSDGTATPIILDESNFEVKNSLNDKLFNYSFSYKLASKFNGQRN